VRSLKRRVKIGYPGLMLLLALACSAGARASIIVPNLTDFTVKNTAADGFVQIAANGLSFVLTGGMGAARQGPRISLQWRRLRPPYRFSIRMPPSIHQALIRRVTFWRVSACHSQIPTERRVREASHRAPDKPTAGMCPRKTIRANRES
jgi:hypothetical protein